VTTGAALVRFLLSSGGVISVMAVLSAWNAWRPSRTARRAIGVAALMYALLAYYPLPHAVGRWLGHPYHALTREDVPEGRIAIVLLGGGSNTVGSWSGDHLSLLDPTGSDRTLEALRAFRLLNAEWIISSGGKPDPDDPDAPAGVAMRDALLHLGVPNARIIVEQSSRTTREQAVNVARLLRSIAADHVVLVTSATHMRRSMGAFQSEGIDAIPAVARDSPHSSSWWRNALPSTDGLEESHTVLHEILGLAYYRLMGWQQ
jgi:uncharacterized SAM-binding protein YcdF (DUF218 family)